MATLKQNQIDLDLSRVGDFATREALEGLIRFVNQLSAGGIKTGGPITGKSVATSSGYAGLAEGGTITGKRLELEDGGAFKVELHEGSLGNGASTSFTVKGEVLGAFGTAEYQGSSTWRVLGRGTTTDSVYLDNVGSTSSKVVITNSYAGTNKYRLVIFYRE